MTEIKSIWFIISNAGNVVLELFNEGFFFSFNQNLTSEQYLSPHPMLNGKLLD